MRPPPMMIREKIVKDLNTAPPKTVLPRSIVAFFFMSQFIFGFNFGFGESCGMSKTFTRLMMAAVGSISTLALTLTFALNTIGDFKNVVYIIQYVPFFVILLLGKNTLCDFLTELSVKNEKAAVEGTNHKVGIFLWIYSFSLFAAKVATAIIYCSLTVCPDGRWMMIDIAIHVPMIALDIMPIITFIIFYLIYIRIKDLRIKHEQRVINLEQLQNSYKEVADGFEKFRCNYDGIFAWSFVTESVKWMIIIWNHLTLMKSSSSWWLHGCSYTWSLINTVQICMPAVFAEMINVQIDAMKKNLHDKLLVETDEAKASELVRLLRYVEARPLLRKAWRLVPVDLRQPVTMLSICTTYLIVIAQFTHLYD